MAKHNIIRHKISPDEKYGSIRPSSFRSKIQSEEKKSDDSNSSTKTSSNEKRDDEEKIETPEIPEDVLLRSRLDKVVQMIKEGSKDIAALTSELIELIQRLIQHKYKLDRTEKVDDKNVKIKGIRIDSPHGDWFIFLDNYFPQKLDLRDILSKKKRKVRCEDRKPSNDCNRNKNSFIYGIRCKLCGEIYYAGKTDREHKRLCKEHPNDLDSLEGQMWEHKVAIHSDKTMEFDEVFEISILYDVDAENTDSIRDFEILWQWLLEALRIMGGMSIR